jgi:hypothetical protein
MLTQVGPFSHLELEQRSGTTAIGGGAGINGSRGPTFSREKEVRQPIGALVLHEPELGGYRPQPKP